MDNQTLPGLHVAVLLTDGFEQVEFTEPRSALEQNGAIVKIISGARGKVKGVHHGAPGDDFNVDATFDEADPMDFDAVLLPGGKENGDRIRGVSAAQDFVRHMDEEGKPIAAICHGSWLLASAGLAQGRTLTSWPSIQDDLRSAGANWVDEEVVVDRNLVTSRKPEDIPAFNEKMVEAFSWRMNANPGTQAERASAGPSS
ncbi:type 1 glutamine amidotransferase domain-containing protein [Noviherbaspirillum denitrificans]|uniref:Glutamine amidotransferase n=1 Tax=Noviherbaspirillum denitrificans TaxID=1968433 RepID=A0A254T810_9BURK|nr:type 1 glutamine amidotransferase domain-containing protein [Noviherbaspirillum denitrificans]OWW18779.1 glutamine amidotransferase [Noviherbaspirillum denitrificans]